MSIPRNGSKFVFKTIRHKLYFHDLDFRNLLQFANDRVLYWYWDIDLLKFIHTSWAVMSLELSIYDFVNVLIYENIN